MPYDWAGTRILQKNTVLPAKRRVFNDFDTLVPTDLREWITPGDREEIRRALRLMELPQHKERGSFDKRAWAVWRWVINNIEYAEDSGAQKLLDYWQFPAETIAVKRGDCEDCAFLLASLLLGAGVSGYCVRVVLGIVTQEDDSEVAHAWPVYKDENGRWNILEATLEKGYELKEMPSAESCTSGRTGPLVYTPALCLNHRHVWQIGQRQSASKADEYLARYVGLRKERTKARRMKKSADLTSTKA